MRYAQIRRLDISDGEGIGIALYVQGCHFHCKNCFNKVTWDFNGGKEWTKEVETKFINMSLNEHIERISILGGEPLALENYDTVLNLCKQIYKPIWLYSGYVFEDLQGKDILNYIDVLVDGRFIDELKDLSLAFRGSSNQRIIDVKESIKNNKVILYME